MGNARRYPTATVRLRLRVPLGYAEEGVSLYFKLTIIGTNQNLTLKHTQHKIRHKEKLCLLASTFCLVLTHPVLLSQQPVYRDEATL